MSATPSGRRIFLDALKVACKKVRNGKYFVKRGVIPWAGFPFDRYERAISIQMDESDINKEALEAKGVLDFGTVMHDDPQLPSIDDGLMDEFFDDAVAIYEAVAAANPDGAGQPFRYLHFGKVAEQSDTDLKFQGILVPFTVGY